MTDLSTFPRVTVPGLEVAPEVREAVSAMVEAERDFEAHKATERANFVRAMMLLGRAVARRTPKKRKPTRHSRRMREIAVRAAYVAETRA